MITKKILFVIFLFFFTTVSTFAQKTEYSKVIVQIDEVQSIQKLTALGFDIDHYQGNPQEGISFFVTQKELVKLKNSEFSFTVDIPNYQEYYNQLLSCDIPKNEIKKRKGVAFGFDFGSLGGFYTLDEVGLKLDEMKQDYPNLITEKTSIGLSIEGRPIWMVKISDNPDINEGEPVAYFDALHHAREPLSMAVTINYMFWLLENYDTNTQIQYLINHRELYFVPVVNPDGYEYNKQTNPSGGGLWRKNRRINTGGCIGVDLNRNYGFQFANNNSCSSPNPCSNIYRGEEAFSEPESSAVRDFIIQIQPKTGFSTHSTAGSYLMPYGYNTSPPDFEIYSEWSSVFLNENNYPYGVTFQMLGYTSCGTTRDYLHSEGIYMWTPEIGGTGFWPQPSEIFDLVAENILPLFYQSWISGGYLDVQSHTQIGNALPGNNFELNVEVKNIGAGATAQNVTVEITSSIPEIIVSSTQNYGDIIARARKENLGSPFTITIDPLFSESSFDLTISTFQEGVLNEAIKIPVFIGEKNILFFDNAESGSTNWLATGNGITWGILNDDSYSGISCFGDSNGGNSENNTTNYFTLNESFNLTATEFPRLSFMSKRSIEQNDVVRLEISTNGSSWNTLETFNLSDPWSLHSFDLSGYTDFDDVWFRFGMQTNTFLPSDGFYFDDFEISDYELEILNVSDNFYKPKALIYPNPFNNKIIIDLDKKFENTFNEIFLYDMHGREIKFNHYIDNNKIILNQLESLVSGVYFIKIFNRTQDLTVIKRLIKY